MEVAKVGTPEVAERFPSVPSNYSIALLGFTCDIMGSDCTQRSILNKAHAHWNRDNAAVPDRAPHAHALMHYSCTCSMMSHMDCSMQGKPTYLARQAGQVGQAVLCHRAHATVVATTIHTRTGASLRLSLGLSPARPSSRCGRRSPTVAACTARAS